MEYNCCLEVGKEEVCGFICEICRVGYSFCRDKAMIKC